MSSCITCGGEIDRQATETKQTIAAKLYPGREVPPPKRCTRCVWTAMTRLASSDDHQPEPAAETEGT